MIRIRHAAPFALLTAAAAVPASLQAVEFHGYMRSGLGASKGGAGQACFAPAGATFGKYRLGNECDTYLELLFSQDIRPDAKASAATDVYYRANVRLSFVTAGERDWEPTTVQQDASSKDIANGDLTAALREAYGEAVNVFAPGVSAWVGKRFYRRHDIHILDFFYVETNGPGVGIENVDAGVGKFHAAIQRNIPKTEASVVGPAQTNFDLRLSDIAMPGGGSLEPIVIYGTAGERDAATGAKQWEAVNGWQVSLLHAQPAVLGGDNTFVVQYGKGLFGGRAGDRGNALSAFGGAGTQNVARGDKAAKDALEDSTSVRVIEQLVLNPTPAFSAALVALWQRTTFGGARTDGGATKVADKTESTIGARPVLRVSDNVDLAFEYGFTRTQKGIVAEDAAGKTTYKDAELHKATIAPQISPAGFWGRPQLRVFATYAKWNDAAKGHVGAPVYDASTSGFSTGAQVEAWW